MKLTELHEKRNKLVADGRALLDKAEKEKRSLTAEEDAQYETIMADVRSTMKEYDREAEQTEIERRVAAAAATTINRPATPEGEARQIALRNFFAYGQVDPAHLRSYDGPRGMESRTFTAGNAIGAGYITTPQEFNAQLIAKVKDVVYIEAAATSFNTNNANGIGTPTLETPPGRPVMITEIKAATEDTAMTFGKRELLPHPASQLIKISDKLLRADGLNIEAIVMEWTAYQYGILKEYMYLVGTGNQQPLGVFVPSSNGIPTSRDYVCTAKLANVINSDDIIAARYNEKAQYQKTAAWMFHRDLVSRIARLKTGDGYYIFKTSDKPGGMDTLDGRPLWMSEYVPNTLTASLYIGIFGDFSKYWVCNSLNWRVLRANELFRATREVGFFFDTEFDGQPVQPEAFTRIKLAAA